MRRGVIGVLPHPSQIRRVYQSIEMGIPDLEGFHGKLLLHATERFAGTGFPKKCINPRHLLAKKSAKGKEMHAKMVFLHNGACASRRDRESSLKVPQKSRGRYKGE
jgi:hypothetical protein